MFPTHDSAHVRATTAGSLSLDNCHPFVHGKLMVSLRPRRCVHYVPLTWFSLLTARIIFQAKPESKKPASKATKPASKATKPASKAAKPASTKPASKKPASKAAADKPASKASRAGSQKPASKVSKPSSKASQKPSSKVRQRSS